MPTHSVSATTTVGLASSLWGGKLRWFRLLQGYAMDIQDIEQLRQLIENTLTELGMPDANWSCVKAESLGQDRRDPKLPFSEVLVVWLTDRNEIEFHAENRSLLKTVGLGQEAAEWGKAA